MHRFGMTSRPALVAAGLAHFVQPGPRSAKGRTMGLLLALIATASSGLETLTLAVQEGETLTGTDLVDPFRWLFGCHADSDVFAIENCFPQLKDLTILAQNFVPQLFNIQKLNTLRIQGMTFCINVFRAPFPVGVEATNIVKLDLVIDIRVLVPSRTSRHGIMYRSHTCSPQISYLLPAFPNLRELKIDMFLAWPSSQENYLGGTWRHLNALFPVPDYQHRARSSIRDFVYDGPVLISYPHLIKCISNSLPQPEKLHTLEIRAHNYLDYIKYMDIETLNSSDASIRSLFRVPTTIVLARTCPGCRLWPRRAHSRRTPSFALVCPTDRSGVSHHHGCYGRHLSRIARFLQSA
jgi:hypothetical protein